MIYFITKEKFPSGMAATKRITCYAKALNSVGEKNQICIYSMYPSDKKDAMEGVNYHYVGGFTNRWPGLLGKCQSFFMRILLMLQLLIKLKKDDAVHLYDQDRYYLTKAIIKVTHFKKAKISIELCELPFGTKDETETTTKQRKRSFAKVFPEVDGIIAISESLQQLALKYCNESCKVIRVPILVEFEEYDMPDKSNEACEMYIFHSGTLYEQKDGFLGMLEAFAKLKKRYNENIKFISTGKIEGSRHETEIKQIIKKYQLEQSVIFTGYLSEAELKKYLSMSILCIINKYPTMQNVYCFSTKLGEYLAAEKAIIITNVGEAMNWLRDRESAYVVAPNDNIELANAMYDLINDSSLRKTIAVNGKNLCKKSFNYINWGDFLKNFFKY